MKPSTILFDWFIVEIVPATPIKSSAKSLFLWGLVKKDQLERYCYGDYVCTSMIKSISPSMRQVVTASNHIYTLLGPGHRIKVSVDEFEMLRNGYSPSEIKFITSN